MHVKNKEIQRTGNKQHERSVSFTCIGNTLTFWCCCIAGAITAAAAALYLRSYRVVCCCFCFWRRRFLGILGKWIIFLKIAYKLIHRCFASPFFYFSCSRDYTCYDMFQRLSQSISFYSVHLQYLNSFNLFILPIFRHKWICLLPFCTFQVSEKNNQLIH